MDKQNKNASSIVFIKDGTWKTPTSISKYVKIDGTWQKDEK